MARASTAPAPARSAREPLVLDRYRLQRRLGAGAFGTVWLARDERLVREVAVKEVPLEPGAGGDAAGVGREALASARLSHPGIVTLYEAGAEDDRAYLVSELVRGRTLADLIGRDELSDRDVLRVGVVLCDALEHAHDQGVIHRDVKPSNVIIPDEPGRGAGVAKLTDFGVAMVGGGETVTHTGDVVGTLAYMAPEQADGHRVTGAADLYALALVLYEALTGSNPVRAAGPAATARRVGRPITPLTRRRPDLPAALADGLDRALLLDPEERGSLEDLREALAATAPDVSDEGRTLAPITLEAAGGVRWVGLAQRAGGALGAGALAAALLGGPAGTPSLSPLAAGAAVALLVGLLPRAGWLTAALGAVGFAAGRGRPGEALLLAAALAAPPLLMWRRGTVWSAPALATVLGPVGLAGAYPALAGQARAVLTRAALGGLGALWACLFELGANQVVVFGRAPAAPPPGRVLGSVAGATDGLSALAASGLLLLVVVWGVAAAILPVIVRGRSAALDFVLAVTWTAGLASATQAVGRMVGPHARHPDATALTLGAVAAGVFAFVAARSRPPPQGEFRSMAPPSAEPM